jgi:hypothetical protein
MPKQFAYQDMHGKIYPSHAALAFQPELVPGWYDTDKRTFTPTGNPQAQHGTIVTDAGHGGQESLLSGLGEDKGANTAPLKGVAFSVAEAQTKAVELEARLEEERRKNAELQAQVAVQGAIKADAPQAPDGASANKGDDTAPAAAVDDVATAPKRVIRKALQ